MKKQFVGTCVNNPFNDVNTLMEIIDKSKEITKATFLKHGDVENHLKVNMHVFPQDYEFFKYKKIYFFTWSMIEHFYI